MTTISNIKKLAATGAIAGSLGLAALGLGTGLAHATPLTNSLSSSSSASSSSSETDTTSSPEHRISSSEHRIPTDDNEEIRVGDAARAATIRNDWEGSTHDSAPHHPRT